MNEKKMIEITERAVNQIRKRGDDKHLRLMVEGGGCSGFKYVFSFDTTIEAGDTVVEKDDVSVVIDEASVPFVIGSVLDYETGLLESRFIVKNPQASSSCGCGISFTL